MSQHYFPAVLFPADRQGLFGVVIPGINVNASAETAAEALAEAGAILQEVIDDLVADGDPVPQPEPVETVQLDGGTLVLLPASVPGVSKRINITMDEDLIRRIDAVAPNRSAFLASAARNHLASAGSGR